MDTIKADAVRAEVKAETDKTEASDKKVETNIEAEGEEKKDTVETNQTPALVETKTQSEAEAEVENEAKAETEVEEEAQEEQKSNPEEKIAPSPSSSQESIGATSVAAVQISSQTEMKRSNSRLRSEIFNKKQKVLPQVDSEMAEQSAAEAKVKGCVATIPQRCPNGELIQDFKITSNTDGCGLSLPKHDALDALMSSALKNKFAPCCNVHNICYSTVGADKDDCDYLFYSCMLDQCDEWFCKSRAFWFYRTVSQLGCATFENVQKINGCGSAF